METIAQSWRKTETGRAKFYAWRRPDPRGWFFLPLGWALLGLALWSNLGDPPAASGEVRLAVGFAGLAVLILSGLLIAGSRPDWPIYLTMAGAAAILGGVWDGIPGARIACVAVAVAIPGIAFLVGRLQRNRLPYRYSEPRVVQVPERAMADYGGWSQPTASGLLDAPVVLLNRWWKDRDFVLTDVDGEVIGRVRDIPHPRTEDGMRAAFDFQIAATAPRHVIEVALPNGEPLFFIDGAEMQVGGTVPNAAGLERSFAIVSPDGRQLARAGSMFFDRVYQDVLDNGGLRLDGDLYAWSKSLIINDGDRTLPCVSARRIALGRTSRPYFTLLDGDGAVFAQVDSGPNSPRVRRLVRFREKVPIVLRMAAIASMITAHEERRTKVLAPDPAVPEPYPEFGYTHANHYMRLRKFMDEVIAEYDRRQTGP